MCWLLLGFVFLLAACGSEGNPLVDTEWQLVALGSADAPAAVEGGADVQFSATSIDGWTGCNGYGGEYSARGAELRLIDVRATARGCPSQALSRQERRILDSLATVERFEVSGERLTIHSEGGQALVFERVGK